MIAIRLTLLTISVVAINVGDARAQHCAPITESYLNGINVSRTEKGLTFAFQYTKTGGQAKVAYQAYLLAYADSAAKQIAELTPQEAIAEKLVTIVDTQLAKRNEAGSYDIRWQLETEHFVEKLLSTNHLSADRTNDLGGWKSYKDEIRLAVFIPFLEDEQYSVIAGLPVDKHECNYGGESALLFETIPPRLTVCFGIVQAVMLEEGTHYIEINGRRPAGTRSR